MDGWSENREVIKKTEKRIMTAGVKRTKRYEVIGKGGKRERKRKSEESVICAPLEIPWHDLAEIRLCFFFLTQALLVFLSALLMSQHKALVQQQPSKMYEKADFGDS